MINVRKLIVKCGGFLPQWTFYNKYLRYFRMLLYSGYIARRINVKDVNHFTVEPTARFVGFQHISIMSGHIRAFSRISAINRYNTEKFNPKILIGENCNIGQNNHIGAINYISIGANFLSGANCLITDHNHGGSEKLDIPPNDRKLHTKGPVIIGNNVHLGENVIILSGVTIGNNVVIGAGSVVTKSLPDNTIVAGNPCKILKIFK